MSQSQHTWVISIDPSWDWLPCCLRQWSIYLKCRQPGLDPWVGKNPWGGKWQPTPVLLPGKFHGRKSLVGYSPWGCKESDMTEWLHFLCFLLRWRLELKSIILIQGFSLCVRGSICATLWGQMGIDDTSHTEKNGTLEFSIREGLHREYIWTQVPKVHFPPLDIASLIPHVYEKIMGIHLILEWIPGLL